MTMPRSARQLVSDRARREALKQARRCVRCTGPNDRYGERNDSGQDAVLCRACLKLKLSEAEARRERAKSKVAEMRRALGMAP